MQDNHALFKLNKIGVQSAAGAQTAAIIPQDIHVMVRRPAFNDLPNERFYIISERKAIDVNAVYDIQSFRVIEKKQFFTFQIGDVLVRGDCPFIWSEQNPLRELAQTYDHLASLRTIRKVEKPGGFSHWELEGV